MKRQTRNSAVRLLKQNQFFLFFVLLMLVFRSSIADWNSVPTGSMKPTIIEGDRIWVNKMAYDLRIPFTHISLLKRSDPLRGDIIVFDSKAAGKRLVKRVIAIPGDQVAMRNNVLFLNGKSLKYQLQGYQDGFVKLLENLPEKQHLIQVRKDRHVLQSSFPLINVPDGYYLALGDNRDNSADSRFIGLIPRNEIVGRTRTVVMSLNYDHYYLPRKARFLHRL